MSHSTQSHLSELRRKHQSIDHEIRDATQHPSADPASISHLKRRKLHLKDEIGRIEATVH